MADSSGQSWNRTSRLTDKLLDSTGNGWTALRGELSDDQSFDGEVITQVAEADAADVDKAVRQRGRPF